MHVRLLPSTLGGRFFVLLLLRFEACFLFCFFCNAPPSSLFSLSNIAYCGSQHWGTVSSSLPLSISSSPSPPGLVPAHAKSRDTAAAFVE